MRRGAGRRDGRIARPGVPDRPYGPRQRPDDFGHARRHRSRPQRARYPARQGRRRSRDRVAGGKRESVMRPSLRSMIPTRRSWIASLASLLAMTADFESSRRMLRALLPQGVVVLSAVAGATGPPTFG